jgi:hypothetical protein
MAKRSSDRTNLDQAIRQMVIEILEDHRPRSGRLRDLMDEVTELRRTVATLERRLEKSGVSTPRSRKRSKKGRPGRPPLHTKCTVPGCTRPHYAKGLCSMHYQQWRRTKVWPGPKELEPAKRGGRKKTRRRTKTR